MSTHATSIGSPPSNGEPRAHEDERAWRQQRDRTMSVAVGIVITLLLALIVVNSLGAAGKIPVKTLSILNVTLAGGAALILTAAAYTRSKTDAIAVLVISLFVTLPCTLVGGLGIGGMCGHSTVYTYGLVMPIGVLLLYAYMLQK